MKAKQALLVLIPVLLWGGGAQATDLALWVVNTEKSTLRFSGVEEGKPFAGHFGSFSPEIVFDEAHLDMSHIKVTVKTGSAVTDDASLRSDMLSKDWLSVEQFPNAVFESKTITDMGTDHAGTENYEASGTLTMLGISKDVVLSFSLKKEGKETRAFGGTTLNRLDFGIGAGVDSHEQSVKNAIKINFDIYAHP